MYVWQSWSKDAWPTSHHDLPQQRAFIPLTRPIAIQTTDIHLITVISRLSVLVLALRSDIDGEAEAGVIEAVGVVAGALKVAGDIMVATIEALGGIVVEAGEVGTEEVVGGVGIVNVF